MSNEFLLRRNLGWWKNFLSFAIYVIYSFNKISVIMMTSSNENIFRVTGPLCGEFPSQRPVSRKFDVFLDLCLNKRLSKHSWGWWFETPSRPLWSQCNVCVCCHTSMFKIYTWSGNIYKTPKPLVSLYCADIRHIQNNKPLPETENTISISLRQNLFFAWWRHQMETFSA